MSYVAPRLGVKKTRLLGHVGVWVLLSALGVLWMVPFLWMVSSSIKTLSEIYQFPPTWLPAEMQWFNYVNAWTRLPFGRFYLNSTVVTSATVIGALLTSSMGGYSFARLRFPGRDKLFLAYIATMMIPFTVLMIPLYVIMRSFGFLDTLQAMILPSLFTAWGTFLMRQYMLALPRELEESAKVDGAGYFGIYWRIILPLCKPVLATLAIFTFLGTWNAFLWPLIVTNTIDNKTVPLGITMFQSFRAMRTPWHFVMAASTFTIIPIMIAFIVGQKYYVRGIQISGLKG